MKMSAANIYYFYNGELGVRFLEGLLGVLTQIHEYKGKFGKTPKVYLTLNSGGGQVNHVRQYEEVIREIDKHSECVIYNAGEVCSYAFDLYLQFKNRKANSNTYFMMHTTRYLYGDGEKETASSLSDGANRLKAFDRHSWQRIVKRVSKLKKYENQYKASKDIYLTNSEAKKLGITN